jgi:predicted aspartyl protease
MRQSIVLPVLVFAAGFFCVTAWGAASLTPLDQFVVAHGYGGAQFVRYRNTYRLPIKTNGKVGDLTIDTGAANAVIFRASLKKFGLTPQVTDALVRGAFGKGNEKLSIVTIHQLMMGNLTLLNVRAAVVSDFTSGALYRPYGLSDGLLGLHEMLQFGMVLDIRNHLILAHPGGPMKGISDGIHSILTKEGYTAVKLSVVHEHLQVPAVVNGTACRLLVDTGAFLTVLDQDFARKARIGGYNTGQYARGLGTGARPIQVTQFPELKIGDFTIKNVSVVLTALDSGITGGDQCAGGLLGAEYLGIHGAIFDFNSGTLYLRPGKSQGN